MEINLHKAREQVNYHPQILKEAWMLVSSIRESQHNLKHPVLPTAIGMLPLSPLFFSNYLQRPAQKAQPHTPWPPTMEGDRKGKADVGQRGRQKDEQQPLEER